MLNIRDDGIAPNAGRLLWAGFMAILAAGVGFGIRGGILANWGAEFGFTAQELGYITGAGFTGFCFGIIVGGVIVDQLGYGKLVAAAFAFHALSAFVTLAASPGQDQLTSYRFLYWGTFLFAVANGTLEAVANPLVATLFPSNRTHYLNILHASWPAGLVLGGLAGWTLGDTWHWKAQLVLFLVPTVIYGVMFLGQHMPRSEASMRGLTLGDMLRQVGILGGLVVCFFLALFFGEALGLPGLLSYALAGLLWLGLALITNFSLGSWLLFVLFLTHALVGAVELGTDSWIQNIAGNILTPAQGKILFVVTSALMFGLRFCADFIEKKMRLSPVGILLVCAVLACIGLNLVSTITTFAGAIAALAVYAIGKTFFWPTMLAVVSDRFPQTGAVAMSIIGGIGMMSAGLMGTPGLGYAKDRFSGAALREADPELYAEYQADTPSKFLFFAQATGLDGKKLGDVQLQLEQAREQLQASGDRDPQRALQSLNDKERTLYESSIAGDRMTLVADSFIPGTMAVIYLALLLYFRAIGGYRPIHIAAELTGGVQGPMEA